jgi:hypothetical protein
MHGTRGFIMPNRRQVSRHAPAAPLSLPRRHFMQSSVLAGAAMALGLPRSSARAAGSGHTVAIVGGGSAGLAAAQALAERGFQVSVYEQQAWGGTARSRPAVATVLAAGREAGYVDSAVVPFPDSAEGLTTAIGSWLQDAFAALGIPDDERAFFASKLQVFMTSCEARRLQQWEGMRWWDYVGAATRSPPYQRLIGRAPLTEASRSQAASARSVGQTLEAYFYTAARQGYRYDASRAEEGSIETRLRYLADLGVALNLGVEAVRFDYANGQVTGVWVRANGQPRHIKADWYVLAVPSANALALLPAAMQEADGRFAGIAQLAQGWVAGAQFVLAQDAQIPAGPFACLHSPWALRGHLPRQSDLLASRGGGGTLALEVSDWTAPGVLYGQPAHHCTPEQIAQELLAQLRNDLPHGYGVLTDRMIDAWSIDSDVTGLGTPQARHAHPSFLRTAGSWRLRPETSTAIPNFFLAGDYVRTSGADFASVPMASESGRRAANALLAASGSSAAPAKIAPRYTSPLLKPQLAADAARFAAGWPNAFDLLDPYYPPRHV